MRKHVGGISVASVALSVVILCALVLQVNTVRAAAPAPLEYFGGPVMVGTRVYIDYWGSEWAQGFTADGYTSSQAEKYINDFFAQVGGSAWANIMTQYCMGIPAPANPLPTSCGTSGTHITNAPGQLADFAIHGAHLPHHLTQNDVAKEALWAMDAFGGYNPHAVYVVLTPPGYYAPDGPSDTSDCAWHGVAYTNFWLGIRFHGSKAIPYAYVPYQPDFPRSTLGCNQHHVNPSWNSYGNGYFDDYSIKAGHEYAEMLTDPYGPAGAGGFGWKDATGHEIGDKCEANGPFDNITLGAHVYAVQALWSNADNGCVMSIAPAGNITEYPLTSGGEPPWYITSGPDGALWFAGDTGTTEAIGRMTTAGNVTWYPLPSPTIGVAGITSGPDGALWFTEYSDKIGRITTSGTITEYPIPTSGALPAGITSGRDGALWFTDRGTGEIGRITTSGTITEYPVSSAGSNNLLGITSGPDGALWFTENQTYTIGRITTSGAVTEYPIPSGNPATYPTDITAGPDGALWFAENGGGNIGRITTSGVITEYPLPSVGSNFSNGITSGRDGALWFTEYNGRIGRITTSGAVTEYPVPTTGAQPEGITNGPDGALWFAEYGAYKIGRITTL